MPCIQSLNETQSNEVNMKNQYLNYLRGDTKETRHQALERFELFCLSLHEYVVDGETYEAYFDEYFRDGTLIERSVPQELLDLSGAESRLNFVVPDELRDLFKNRFAIYDTTIDRGRYGNRRVMEIYGPSSVEQYSHLHAFCSCIAWNFGEYFCREQLSPEQMLHLNSRYFCFGRWSNDDHESTYLLVDRDGGFGSFHFHTEDYPGSLTRLEPLLEGAPLTMHLDELIVKHIDMSIEHLLNRNDIPSSND
jgi:hypothetical protein